MTTVTAMVTVLGLALALVAVVFTTPSLSDRARGWLLLLAFMVGILAALRQLGIVLAAD